MKSVKQSRAAGKSASFGDLAAWGAVIKKQSEDSRKKEAERKKKLANFFIFLHGKSGMRRLRLLMQAFDEGLLLSNELIKELYRMTGFPPEPMI